MSKENIRLLYDRIARMKIKKKPKYTVVTLMNWTKLFSPDRNEVVHGLIQNTGTFLDVGVGEGWQLRMCVRKFQRLCGIDISSVRVQHLKKDPELKKVKLSTQNIEDGTTFRSSTFDTITMVAVLEHVFDPHITLDELHRILKPKGELIIEVPNIGWLYPRISLLFGHFPITSTDPGFDGGHLHYFEVHNLTKLLNEHGFTVETVMCSGLFSVFRRWWPALLGGDLIMRMTKHSRKRKRLKAA